MFVRALVVVDHGGGQDLRQRLAGIGVGFVFPQCRAIGDESHGHAEAFGRQMSAVQIDGRVQQEGPQAGDRPVRFAEHVFGGVAAELAAAEGLLEVPVEEFDAPPQAVEFCHLPVAEAGAA